MPSRRPRRVSARAETDQKTGSACRKTSGDQLGKAGGDHKAESEAWRLTIEELRWVEWTEIAHHTKTGGVGSKEDLGKGARPDETFDKKTGRKTIA